MYVCTTAPYMQCCAPNVDTIRVLRGHQLPVTCVAMTPDARYIYSGSKDCCIIKCKVGTWYPSQPASTHTEGRRMF